MTPPGAQSATLAETREVRIAQQFGLNYLPLTVMRKHKLIEKKATEMGLGEIRVTWLQFGAGAGMNDALLSRSLDFASGGVGPLLTIWDKSRGTLDVKGVASLGSMPLYLTTTNPAIKTVKDFGGKDKIALPAAKVSIQAVVLQMAAAQAFGDENYTRLDSLTVSMKHPDAMAAMLSAGTEINAHFGNAPFQEQELQDPKVHQVLSSYDVVGPSTLNSVYTTAKFRTENPNIYRSVLAALKEAVQIINQDKKAAAQLYVEEEKSRLSPEFVFKILSDPDFIVTATPQGIAKYASFMYRIKSIRNQPNTWKDVYFPEIHDEPGS
ncbi:MAG: ABC transporter substrate-binding protein [Betaproteobacteria bacterium]